MQARIDLQNMLGQVWVQKPELQALESVVIKETDPLRDPVGIG